MRLSDQTGCIRWTLGSRSRFAGPMEMPFPVETELKGKDLLFIAGGMGLAPLRSVINYCTCHIARNYGEIDVVYGSRSKDDLRGSR